MFDRTGKDATIQAQTSSARYSVEYLEFDGGHVVPTVMIERAFARCLG